MPKKKKGGKKKKGKKGNGGDAELPSCSAMAQPVQAIAMAAPPPAYDEKRVPTQVAVEVLPDNADSSAQPTAPVSPAKLETALDPDSPPPPPSSSSE